MSSNPTTSTDWQSDPSGPDATWIDGIDVFSWDDVAAAVCKRRDIN